MNIDPITIKRLCKENGTNLKKVSCKLGIPYNTIYSATKRGSCNKELAELIASYFDVDVSYISGGLSDTKLGLFLLKGRKEKGLTQEELAQEIGVTKAAISRYEKGERTPNIYLFAKMCSVLDISPDELIGAEKEKIPKPCPFCGAESLVVKTVDHVFIRCRNSCCEQCFLYEKDDDAIEDWNRRKND